MTWSFVKTKTVGLIGLNTIIICFLDFLPVSASYQPPPMQEQKPQRATISGSRGSCADYSQVISPLFPQAKNLVTSLPQPVFLFQLKSALNHPAYLSLVDNEQIYPLYQRKIDHASPGLLAFQIPTTVELKPEQTYRLNFVIVCDEQKPSHNWSVSTLITRTAKPPLALSTRSKAGLSEALLLSQAGFWFDALTLVYQNNLIEDAVFDQLFAHYREVSHSAHFQSN